MVSSNSFIESAKSRAWRTRVLCVFTCSSALRALRVYVLSMLACLRPWCACVRACVRAWLLR